VEIESVDFILKGTAVTVQARVRLSEIWHRDVKVEAVGSNGMGGIWKQEFLLVSEWEDGVCLYECEYPHSIDDWFRADANVRIVPISPDFANEFELELSKWGTRWR
jgi:starch phosphorylase